MKNFTNFESNVSGLTRVCLGFVSGLSRFSLGEVAEKCGRYAAMIAILLTFSCGNVWGQTTIYNTGWEGGIGTWSGSLTITEETTNVRTGSKAIKGSYTGSNSAKNAIQATGTTTTSEKATYCHIIGWAKSANGTMKAQIGFNSSKKGSAVTLSTSNWTQLSYVGNEINATTIILYKQGNASADKYDVYFDDVVSYYSSSNTTDVTAPSAATSASATTSSISWTNGTDSGTGATGRQTTSIWRRTSGDADDLTLNNQGIYAMSATDQSGHWTCVSATVAKGTDAATSSYEGTFSGGDRYAIVHRDLAYNYSSPTYVTITADAGSGWGIAGTMNSWTAASNEMTGSGTVSTTINLSANSQYEFKVVDTSTDTWYGNGGTIKGGITDWEFTTEGGNTYLRTSCAGDYTFTFNTSTKNLSITYPNSNKVYFAKGGASWSNIYAYCYNDNDWNIGWPGIEITSNTEDNCGTEYYAYTNGYTYIIFNNGSGGDGNQTGDITVAGYSGKHAVGDTATKWVAYPTYTVTYNANGDGAGNATGTTGSVPTDGSSPYACGSTVTVLGNTGSLAKTGYAFDGWNTAPGGGGTSYAAAATFTISANTTLYAKWAVQSYDLTWNLGGGTTTSAGTGIASGVSSNTTTSQNYGTSLTAPTVTKTGYNFNAWSPAVASTMPAANTTYTATWTAKTTTITIDDNDENHGSTTPGTVTATWGSALPSFTAASGASGYGLKGYYTAATSGDKIVNADGTLVRNTDYATDESTPKWKYETSTLTLYPQYELTCRDTVFSVAGSIGSAAVKTATATVNWGTSLVLGNNAGRITIKPNSGKFKNGDVIYLAGNTGSEDKKFGVKIFAPDGTTDAGQPYTDGNKSSTSVSGTITLAADADSLFLARYDGTGTTLTQCIISRVADCPVAPSNAEITPTNGWIYVPGEEIELTASADDTDAATTYTWYRGATLEAAKAAGAIQAAKTAAAGGTTYTIASCTASDAARYWCEISNGTGYETSASYDIKIYTFFLYDNTSSALGSYAFDAIDRDDKKISVSFNLANTNYTYYFKLSNGLNVWFGTPSGNDDACITGSTPYLNALQEGAGNNIGLKSSFADEYTVEFYYNSNNIVVTYPVHNQAANKVVYFDNTLTEMDNMYIRIGHDANSSASSAFTLVPGTANLYRVKTIAWSDFHAWSIADNTGWTGSNTIYQPWYDSEAGKNKPDDEYAITKQTDYQRYVVDDTISIIPTDEDNEEYGCQYYTVDKVTGMKTQTVTISDYSNGTITVNYVDTSNTARSFTSGSKTLAHTCVLTVTATPAEGYSLTSLTINETAHTSGNTHTLSAAATIAATFTANTTTITINANTSHHGSTTPGTVTATFGSALPSFTAAAGESGWNLTGYFTAETSGTKVINANGTLVASTDYADGSGNWKYETASLTLYAQYEEEGCTPQSISKVVVTGSSAGTTSGYNEKEYVGTPVINVSGKTADATNIDGKSGDETGYKMSDNGTSIVFATLSKGTFQEGDVVKIGITHRNDTRQVDSKYNILTIYYGTNKDDAKALTTIETDGDNDNSAADHEGAGFYTYTLTSSDVTTIGTKKGIGLFRESSNGENPYVYSVEIIGCRDWTTCTAPTAVAADDVTGTSATFTITDAENTNNYELYVSTSGTSPTAETSATATSSEKTKTVTGLSGTTTYYYWVRSNCGGFKSAWVAGTPATFTTETAYTVTYNGNGSTGGSVPTDATGYAEGDVVTVKTNSGSLVKSGGYTFVGWSTNATPSSGIFYPAGYKFTMGAGNVTLYAVWASGGASAYYYGSVSITAGALTPGSTGGHKGFFTNEGGTVATSSDISLSSTPSETSFYYESSTLTHTELSKSSNWNTSSSSKRTIRAFKFANNTSYTLALGSATATKITFYGKCGSASRILSVGGVEWTSNSTKETFEYNEFTKVGNFTGNITIGSIDASSDNRGDFYGILVVTMAGGSSGYTVTFDKNGKGSYSNSINNVPSGSKIGVPIPAPTATGYEFGGWYREAGCSNEWNFGSNTITKDTTLYAKWTTCAPTISVHPSGTIYNQGAAATALSVTAATNDGGTLEYQWYSNEEDSNEDGTEIPGATSASYTPSTELVGTIYYYCVVTNDCGNVTSNVAAITVNDSKPNPTASWTIATPTHGGKGFSFSVTAHKNDGSTAWDGTLTTAMLSASEDVVLSGVTVSDNTISGTYGVKASATSPVTFYLELPSTTTQAAATLSEDKEFTACSGTGVDGSTYEVPVTAKYSSSASGKPSYLCETTYGYISPELGTSSVSLKSQTYDDFEYWMNSGRTSVLICTKVDAVKKIQIYLSANGGAAKVTNVYTAASYSTALKDYTALDAKSDYTVTYTDESGNSSIAKGENGHVDIAFTTNLDSGTVVYVALKDAAKFYGAKLTTGAGSGATIDTELAWSNSQSDGATVEKGEDDAEFTITASRSGAAATASLGEIRYSSSDTKIATVNATTGEVTIADTISFGEDEYKTTTIKATLVSSGCYKSASITYTLQVNKSTCKEAAGTVAITNESDCSVELTVSGYEDDATIQWQKDGSDIPSATSTTYTATTSGTYTAVTTKDCARTSNSIVVAMSATATASKIVDSWYVKNGRRTPDIALVQTTGATSFTVKSGETTIWDEANTNTTGFGGCDFELKEDGIIYLHGTKSNGDAPSDLVAGNETITVTVSGCGGALSGLDIIIKKQAETLKPSVAFVVDGTTRAKGGTATSVSTAKTSERPLWTYLSSSFTLTGCNIYWSVDSKELREYYSQYDAIVVTDDPKTQTTGAGGVEYVKAFGTLVDVRPILTMEAYVGRYTDGGWHVYNATPTSPNPRQVEMKLECKTHEIFAGVNDASDNVRTVTVNGDDYWYITIVDTTQSPYKGTTMDYKDLPALQGFDPSSFSDMLGIGTIHDDALQAGVERQQEPAARMMILGIQNNAMGALTNEGKLIIKNAISYLLKTNMEEVDDCSNYFTGATNTDWNEPTNWSKNSVPDFATKVRIMAPVVISDGQKVRASQVDIVVDGTSSQKDGKPEGTVTINPGGALVVGGTVNRAIAPHYGIDDLEPTTSEDLIVQANADKSAALILDNSSGLTGATVQMYSSSFWELVGSVKKKYWSYVAVPIQEALIPDYFYGAFTYYYEEKSGWEKKWDGDYLYPFQGIGLSRDAAGIENFWGPLVSTENRDIKLTKTAIGGGENLIANSWTAPIQIANFDADDFGDALATIYIYNTGKKDSYAGSTVIDANTSNQGAFTAGQWLGIPIGVAKLPEYTGLKVIPAMQTFEVDIPGEAPNGTETTLHLDYDRLVRGVNLSTDNLTEKLHAPKRSMNKNDGDVEAVMKVRVAGVHTLAEVWLIQDGAFGEGFDNGWEAYYAACDDRSPQLYAHSENGNMGIIAKQELEGTILGFAPSRDGADYTFSFYYRGDEELYLNDLLTETSTPITNEDTYSFTSSNNGNSNRFIISRNPYQSPLITTGTEEIGVEGQNSAKKIIYNDKIYILYNGVIYDAMGKVINRK